MSAVDFHPTERVDAMHPGFRVIAGPFRVEEGCAAWREERRQCEQAWKLQRRAGVPVKVVKVNGLAYVLRSAEGWQECARGARGGGGEVVRLSVAGLCCPVCGRPGFIHARALRVHRCPKLPLVLIGGRMYHDRLSVEQVEQAEAKGGRS